MRKQLIAVLSVFGSATIFGQTLQSVQSLNGNTINPITTAVPFMQISPDSKAGAMGDVGAATDPDVNAIHWNGSKLAFAEKQFGVGITATPWLRRLVPDIWLYYLAGYGKINENQVVGASLRYFTLGNIDLTDATGVYTGSYKPNEFAVDVAFSQKLSRNFGLGIAMRFINSSISRVYFNGSSGNAASTFAVDLSGYYKSEEFKLGDKKSNFTAGAAITNIGAKIKYSNDQNFIPINLRLGTGLRTYMDDYNSFGLYLDLNKLLVPTPPIYAVTATGGPVFDPATGERVIAEGKNPNVSVPAGMLQSFYDAPGGFKEEMQEINICTGLEYNYNNIFFARGGYFYEPRAKGSRQFFTFGAGFRMKVVTIDGSFLVPTTLQNPLQNTFRFSINFYFDSVGKTDKGEVTP